MTRDARALTDQVEHFDPLSFDQVQKARLTVCANAIDSIDATELMMMLGIHPSQPQDDTVLSMPPRRIEHLY